MTGPRQTKAICPRCQVNKWAVDYKEGCFEKITPTSICLFCELKELHKKEIAEVRKKYDQEIRELQETVESLMTAMSGLRENGVSVDTPSYAQVTAASPVATVYRPEPIIEGQGVKAKTKAKPSPEYQKRKDKQKKNTASGTGQNSGATGTTDKNTGAIRGTCGGVSPHSQSAAHNQPKTTGRKEDSFTKVVGKRAARTPAPNRKEPVKTTNRFGPLSMEEEFAVLVGDSQVRNQEKYFGAIQSSRRKITCLPGRKTVQLCKAVQKVILPGRKSAVVAQVSGNDLFLKGNKVGNTEPIIREALSLVDEVEQKTDRGMILGIIPRLSVSSYATSKLISLNERLANKCNSRAVKFIDPFSKFYRQHKLYQRDGVHLNSRGQAVLGDLINENLFSLYRACSREAHQQPSDTSYSLIPRVVSQPAAQTTSGTSSPRMGRSREEVKSHPTPEVDESAPSQRSEPETRSTAREKRRVNENAEPSNGESESSDSRRYSRSHLLDGGAVGGPMLPQTPDRSGNGES